MAFRTDAASEWYTTTANPITTTGTILCWFKMSVNRATYSTVWVSDNSGANSLMLVSNSAGLVYNIWNGGVERCSLGTLVVGTWYRMAVTFTGTTLTRYFAAEGAGSFNVATGTYTPVTAQTGLWIGGYSRNSLEWFNGAVANFKHYDAVLSEAECWTELSQYAPTRRTNLIKWYPFLRPETTDYSGTGATLTTSGTPTWEAGPNIPVGTAVLTAPRFDNQTDGYLMTAGSGRTTGTFTWLGWAKLNVDLNLVSTVFAAVDTPNAASYRLNTTTDGVTLRGQTASIFVGTQVMTVGTWYALAFTCSGGTACEVYTGTAANALTKATGTSSEALVTPNNYLGRSDVSARNLDGCITGVKTWSAVLSQAEIEAELAQVAPVRTANLLRWNPLLCPDVLDYSGGGFNWTAGTTVPTAEPVALPLPMGTVTWPVVVNRSQGTTASGTSHAFTMPTGYQPGDLLLVNVALDGSSAMTPVQAGWTQLGRHTSGTAVTWQSWYKIATGDDALTITTTTEESGYVVHAIRNATVSTALGFDSLTGTTSNPNPPARTPTGGAQNFLYLTVRAGDAQVAATAAPTGYVNMTGQAGGTTTGATIHVAEKLSAAASDDPGAWTAAAEDWVAITISIPPALPAAPALSTLVENFDDNSIDAAIWTANFGIVAESGGQARVTATTDSGFISKQTYSLDATGVYVRVPQVSLVNTSSFSYTQFTVWSASQPNGTDLCFSYEGGPARLDSGLRVGFSVPGGALTYNATDHAWWRIRLSGGNVLFDTAPDNAGSPGSWTQRNSVAAPAYASRNDLGVRLQAGRSGGTSDVSLFDGLNTTAVAAPAAPPDQPRIIGQAVNRAASF